MGGSGARWSTAFANTFRGTTLRLDGAGSGSTDVAASSTASGTLTLPAATDTLVARATIDTLENKTLTAPDINGGTADALTSLGVRSTGAGAFDLQIKSAENLTANRALTVAIGDAARTLTLSGNPTLSDWFDQSVKSSASPTFAGLTVTKTGNLVLGWNSDTAVFYRFQDSGAGTDLKYFDLVWDGGALDFRLLNDNTTVKSTPIRIGSANQVKFGGEVRVAGDIGGEASTNTLTGASDVTANSTGVGTVKFKGATSRDSAGFLKVYIGTTPYYVPVFSAISG